MDPDRRRSARRDIATTGTLGVLDAAAEAGLLDLPPSANFAAQPSTQRRVFLARVAKGSHMVLEQTRVNDEVWLPKRLVVNVTARIGLVKRLDVDREVVFSEYRKFQVDSHITGTKEVNRK
jgi:hypothetical protein